MATINVKRKNREIRDTGTICATIKGSDVGSTIDFMGIPEGFRIVGVNVTVDEAFANSDNKVSVGIEGDLTRFLDQSALNAVAGFDYNKRQLTANTSTAIIADIVGSASTVGKAVITVSYVKLPVSKQEY